MCWCEIREQGVGSAKGRAYLRGIYGFCKNFHADLDRVAVKQSCWFCIFEVDYQHILLVDSIANLL
jgi:hypothetical protein